MKVLATFFGGRSMPVRKARPGQAMLRHRHGKPKGGRVVVGAGKASAAMAAALDAAWPDIDPTGAVAAREVHAAPTPSSGLCWEHDLDPPSLHFGRQARPREAAPDE